MESTTRTLLCLLSFAATFLTGNGYDSRDHNGHVVIRWDIFLWTPDGYVAGVNITNYQVYRPVAAPGWKLQWTWSGKEVLWTVLGANVTDSGNCSRFKDYIPQSCSRRPMVVDLPPAAPARMKHVPPTRFITPDGRRVTQALMTWEVVCSYTPPLARKVPSCCVSVSSDQGMKTTPCPTCACSCSNASNSCHAKGSKHGAPPVKCTDHMCPVAINWHMNHNQKRILVSISNLNRLMKYSDWVLLVEHPAMRNLTRSIHANHRLLPSAYSKMEVFWGVKNYNQALSPFGTHGSSTTLTLLFRNTAALWKSPKAIFFNGDLCAISLRA